MPGRTAPVRSLITAEHASRRVPGRWAHCFEGQDEVLATHRAWDPGSGRLARLIANRLDAPLMLGGMTRLLVDLNRPSDHRNCFSAYSEGLSPDERQELLASYHQPYWQRYRDHVAQSGRCLHLACHSFTPVLDGQRRLTDIGVLFDPGRALEARWCHGLIQDLRLAFPELRVHANQPYRGTSSGLGQQHRAQFAEDKLWTAELEINSALLLRASWASMQARLVEVVSDCLS